MAFIPDVGIVHTSNGPKADYPWLCVDLGEEAIIYSTGFYAVYGSKLTLLWFTKSNSSCIYFVIKLDSHKYK